jgi:hypothetical protein
MFRGEAEAAWILVPDDGPKGSRLRLILAIETAPDTHGSRRQSLLRNACARLFSFREMDFLLECIGFPPDTPAQALLDELRARGERVAWRGPRGEHLRLALAGGMELRADREEDQPDWTILPYFEVQRRLRVAVQDVQRIPDSTYDVLLQGIANPPVPGSEHDPTLAGFDYPIATYLTDGRRFPVALERGRVVAISIAGFALDVSYVGENQGVKEARLLEEPHGAELVPLGGAGDAPRGCMQLSLRIKNVRRLRNPLSGIDVDVLEADAPGRPVDLFVSHWQLGSEGFEAPRPGWRIEGVFFFTGRLSGGLHGPASQARARFG